MATLATEIYVSQDGINYSLLDLYKDEAINIKFILRDSKDPSKIYTPYSLTFKVPASEKNLQVFSFYGDPFFTRSIKSTKMECKIYVNGNLSQSGILKISNVSYQMGNPIDFSCNFSSSLVSLKERLGDDLITGLDAYDAVKNPNPLVIDWEPATVYGMLGNPQAVNGGRVKIPFASMDRVWSYDPDSSSTRLDNIAYLVGRDPNSNFMIKTSEVRPALNVGELMNKLISKYDLDVSCPLFNREEFSKLWVWCTNETFQSDTVLLKGITPFSAIFNVPCRSSNTTNRPNPPRWNIAKSPVDDKSVRISYNPAGSNSYRNNASFRVTLESISTSSTIPITEEDVECTFTFVNKNTREVYFSETVGSLGQQTNKLCQQIPGRCFTSVWEVTSDITGVNIGSGSVGIDVEVYVSFSKPIVWRSTEFSLYTYTRFNIPSASLFAEVCQRVSVNNYQSTQAYKLSVYETLPPMKCIDFLTSFFNMFNISFLDNDSENSTLEWLTPQDINPKGIPELLSSNNKRTVDYTKYLDYTNSTRAPLLEEFSAYNYKYATSKYKSNVDYKNSTGVEYGQEIYSIEQKDKKEYKVELKFATIPPVIMPGSTIHTYYGFNADTPDYTEINEARYKPNYNEFTLFYDYDLVHGNLNGLSIGCQVINGQNQLTYLPLPRINRFLPFTKAGKKSLLFSIYNDDSFVYVDNNPSDKTLTNTLYSRYYKDQTEKALNPNVYKEAVTLNLPASELYIRKTGDSRPLVPDIPLGFRLQNDVILNEMRYSIDESQIDITTGKTKLLLTNYI